MATEDQNQTPHAAPANSALYTPPSIGHAERVVQHLLQRYRRKTLAECQQAVAAMYGHPAWQSLQAAIASGVSISRYDEEETPEVVHARRRQQYEAALARLGGVTEAVSRAAEALDQALLGTGGYTIRRHDPQCNERRVERARCVYNTAYARQVVEEILPSARAVREIPPDDDEIDLMLRVDLLPRALKAWLGHHRPLLDRWASIVGAARVRQRCPTELLDLAFTWGELCVVHGIEIPKAMQVYPIALCGQWYAWLACLAAPGLQADLAVLDGQDASAAQRRRSQQIVSEAIRDEEARFMLVQPREDLRSLSHAARRQQMHAGHAVLKRYMADAAAEHTIRTILAKPSWLAPAATLKAG